MKYRAKLAIVAGRLNHSRLLQEFEPLKQWFDVTVYVFNDETIIERHKTGLRLKVYDEVRDMSDYMRGLECELESADVIVALETSSLSSFQACRVSVQSNKLFLVYSTNWQPYLYTKFPNIAAIQFDIVKHASAFFCPTLKALEVLKSEGSPADKIHLSPLAAIDKSFIVSAELREKFRKYLRMNSEDRIILVQNNLEQIYQPKTLLQAFGLLKSSGKPGSENLKLFFVGTGSLEQELKYMSYDLGVGNSVLFLHQDPEPFLQDLYNATDFSLYMGADTGDELEECPFRVLEQMACGVIPIVKQNSIAAELAGAGGVNISADNYRELALQLDGVLFDCDGLMERRINAIDFIAELRSQPTLASEVRLRVEQHLAISPELESDSVPGQKNAELKSLIELNEFSNALVLVEDLLLLGWAQGEQRTELLCRRGDIQYSLGNIEAAAASYQECVQHSPNDDVSDAYRGLGFVAWQSHSNDEALTFFKKSLARMESDAMSMFGIGLVNHRVGLSEEAIFWFERSILTDSSSGSVLVALIQACGECSNVELATTTLEGLLSLDVDQKPIQMCLGNIYLKVGKVAEGNSLLTKALSDAA